MTGATDDRDDVLHVDHLQQPYVATRSEREALAPVTPQGIAEQYLREVGTREYGIDESMLPGATTGLTEEDSDRPDSALVLTEEKEILSTTSVSYQQTYRGLPVWEAGVNVTVLSEP